MKSGHLSPDEIIIIQPKTPEEVDALAEDIHTLASLLPTYEPDFLEGGMRDFPEAFTLVYHQDRPVAYIEINDATSHDLGKRSLSFGGCVTQEYRKTGLTHMVAPIVIKNAFTRRKMADKMLAFIDPENKEARMAICALGFRYFGDKDGEARYKLSRSDFFRGQKSE